jgi:lipopolysaccharide/colanic/teichoic acid biosynthesis glycosyltransferase
MYRKFFKRFLDFWFSFFLIIILTPLFVTITFFLIISNKSFKVFFLQERPGRYEKIFRVIKYKTMTDERDAEGKLLPDSQRLTRVGRFVRSTSIDELPQLFNVLKGDMALIGPRPLLVKYLDLYNPNQHRRHEVRPGITGWAQCHGRNAISWTQKFKLDVWYVENYSIFTDLKVIFITIKKVLKRDGINQKGYDTIEAFNGKN